MPINKETIISVFSEKLTLEQWLKNINNALEEAVLTGVQIVKKGNATLSFKFTFEDGTFLESNDIVLQQGESVQSAYIQNGHLYLTLTNDQTLDAGNVKPVSNFAINGSQHLIVNYADGTSQDLGAIFQGNVNISGTLTTSGNATIGGTLTISGNTTAGNISAGNILANSLIENMTGYSFVKDTSDNELELEYVYVGAVKTGNKLTLVLALNLRRIAETLTADKRIGSFYLPLSVLALLYPVSVGGYNYLVNQAVPAWKSDNNHVDINTYVQKGSDAIYVRCNRTQLANLDINTKYYFRLEMTFLLSNNLAQ